MGEAWDKPHGRQDVPFWLCLKHQLSGSFAICCKDELLGTRTDSDQWGSHEKGKVNDPWHLGELPVSSRWVAMAWGTEREPNGPTLGLENALAWAPPPCPPAVGPPQTEPCSLQGACGDTSQATARMVFLFTCWLHAGRALLSSEGEIMNVLLAH